MSLYDFFKDLRNRKFFKEISIYGIAAWLIIQVSATTFPHIGISDYWVTIIIVLCLIGLPIWMLISWRYNIFDEAENPEQKIEESIDYANISKQFKKLTVSVTVFVVALSSLIIWNKFSGQNANISKEDKVAVAIFDNLTGEESLTKIGKLISNYLTQGLTETNSVKVVSFNSINGQSEILMKNNIVRSDEFSEAGMILAERNKASKLIRGNYFLQKDQMMVLAEILSNESNVIEVSFPEISCLKENPIDCAEQLRQKVLGYWAIKNEKANYKYVPDYDAYIEMMTALEFQEIDFAKTLEHLERANSADSTFMEPFFHKIALFISNNDAGKAHELIEYLSTRRAEFSTYEKNYFQYYQALLKGDALAAFKYFDQVYALDHQNLQNNMNAAYLSLAYLNDPDRTLKILNYIEEDTIDYFKNFYSNVHRSTLFAWALTEKAAYAKAIEVLDNIEIYEKERIIRQIRIRCAVRQGDYQKLDQILTQSSAEELDNDYRYLYYSTAVEFDLIGDIENRNKYGNQALNLYVNSIPTRSTMIGRCHYLLENWPEAENQLSTYIESKPNSIFSIAQMAAIHAHRSQNSVALEWINKLDALATAANKSEIFYHKGRVLCILGDTQNGISNLIRSLNSGQTFSFINFHHDPDIKKSLKPVDLNQILDRLKDK